MKPSTIKSLFVLLAIVFGISFMVWILVIKLSEPAGVSRIQITKLKETQQAAVTQLNPAEIIGRISSSVDSITFDGRCIVGSKIVFVNAVGTKKNAFDLQNALSRTKFKTREPLTDPIAALSYGRITLKHASGEEILVIKYLNNIVNMSCGEELSLWFEIKSDEKNEFKSDYFSKLFSRDDHNLRGWLIQYKGDKKR